MTSKQCADNGAICHNCVNIITEALQRFILPPFVEGLDLRDIVWGKRIWHTRHNHKQVLSENQSSQFGKSPSECYVCFRSSQLVQTAGPKKMSLSNTWWFRHTLSLRIMDEAESKIAFFTLNFGNGKKSYTYSLD